MDKTYTITVKIRDGWVKDANDLKSLLEQESNLWSVTHCEDEIEVKEVA